jgi:predicted nuclease of predicted toxin-antitoxin system
MKLLLDENLSPKLPSLLGDLFPGSIHVRDCGLKGKSDQIIWDYAREHEFTLVSKDGDFYQRTLLFGPPPKLVWLCVGNCSRAELLNLLTRHAVDINRLESATESVLLLT